MKNLAIVLLLAATSLCPAATLQSAKVTRVVNEVNIYKPGASAKSANVGATIRGRTSIQTGSKSRSELKFQDSTITRLGANTVFSFQQGTRDLQLQQGTLLLQVPKNAGGARIRTSSVTAAITGTTIMIEFYQGKWIKIIVLEGTLELFVNAIGRRVTIREGQILFMKDDGRDVPIPVDVEIARIMRTSGLVLMGPLAGPALAAINRRIVIQTNEQLSGELVGVNIVRRTRGDQAVDRQGRTRDVREEAYRRYMDRMRDNRPGGDDSPGDDRPPGGDDGPSIPPNTQ